MNTNDTVTIPIADLKRIQLYVDDAALGEYGYVEPEGKLCSGLIDKALRSDGASIKVQFVVPPAGANHGHSPEAIAYALAAPRLNEAAERVREGLNALANAMVRGDLKLTPEGAVATVSTTIGGLKTEVRGAVDPIGELSAVLWFLSTLALDHGPGCAIKQADGSACDCDKPIPDGDEWYTRVRLALGLPEKIREQFNKRGERLIEFEQKLTPLAGELEVALPPLKLVDAVVAYVAELKKTVAAQGEKLKNRRVVRVKPVPSRGSPGVFEFRLKDEISHLAIFQLDPSDMKSPQDQESWQAKIRTLQEKLGGQVLGLMLPFGWELTVLELP